MAKILSIVEAENITKNEEKMTRYIFSDDKIVYVRAKNDEILPKTTSDKYVNLINTYIASKKAESDSEPKEQTKPGKKPDYNGISGWLLFLVISIFFGAFTYLISGLVNIAFYYSSSEAAGGVASLGVAALWSIAGAFILCEKRSAKILFTIAASFSALVYFISTLENTPLYYTSVEYSGYLFGAILGAFTYPAIWIPYIWTSRRVKATLIK